MHGIRIPAARWKDSTELWRPSPLTVVLTYLQGLIQLSLASVWRALSLKFQSNEWKNKEHLPPWMPVDNSNNCSCCYYNKRNWKLALQFWGSKGRLKLKIILDGSIHWRREWHRQKTFSQVFYVKDCSYIHCQFIWYDANRAARFIINLHRYLDGATQNVTKVSFSAV